MPIWAGREDGYADIRCREYVRVSGINRPPTRTSGRHSVRGSAEFGRFWSTPHFVTRRAMAAIDRSDSVVLACPGGPQLCAPPGFAVLLRGDMRWGRVSPNADTKVRSKDVLEPDRSTSGGVQPARTQRAHENTLVRPRREGIEHVGERGDPRGSHADRRILMMAAAGETGRDSVDHTAPLVEYADADRARVRSRVRVSLGAGVRARSGGEAGPPYLRPGVMSSGVRCAVEDGVGHRVGNPNTAGIA